MKVLTVVGARPQFIKAAAVSRVLRPRCNEILVHTGQHYDENLSRIFFQELDIPEPDYHLGIGSGSHGRQTGRMLEAVERILRQEAPDWVLVYGDTNSTLAGALAAVKLHIPVAHVEAGLRSYNRRMPEEVNRVLTDHASDLLFPPTETAEGNLVREGLPAEKIYRSGDVMYDAALYYAARAEAHSRVLEKLALQPGAYVLATIHRAENTDDPERLEGIFRALGQVAEELPVVVPLHPRTRNLLAEREQGPVLDRLQVIDPVGYLDMVMLEKNARTVVTDSGGVQKEAFFCRVPCITVRSETEWVELVSAGWNTLVPPGSNGFVDRLVEAALRPAVSAAWQPFYGEGDAAERVVGRLNS